VTGHWSVNVRRGSAADFNKAAGAMIRATEADSRRRSGRSVMAF
jgi:hypothetical protein